MNQMGIANLQMSLSVVYYHTTLNAVRCFRQFFRPQELGSPYWYLHLQSILCSATRLQSREVGLCVGLLSDRTFSPDDPP